MELKIKISLADDDQEGFMGIGLVWLLRRIRRFQSIKRASEDMGMSYVKALRILNRLEENLDRKVLIRTKGGRDQGGAKLTPFGERFIDEYDRFQKEIKQAAEEKFAGFRNRMAMLEKEK